MEIVDRVTHKVVQFRVVFRRGIWRIVLNEAPQHGRVFGVTGAYQIEKQRIADWDIGNWRLALMNMPDGIADLCLRFLPREAGQVGQIFIHILRDHIKVKPLCLARGLIHEERQAFRAGIAQPFVNGQTIAAGL